MAGIVAAGVVRGDYPQIDMERGYLATRILFQAGFPAANIGGGYQTYQLFAPRQDPKRRRSSVDQRVPSLTHVYPHVSEHRGQLFVHFFQLAYLLT
jgi:hypothetical protein